MATTVIGTFPSRREVELAVEHLVQEYGFERTDIFIEPVSDANSAGVAATGADAESGHPGRTPDARGAAYKGALRISIDMNKDEVDAVERAFREAGATEISRT